MAESRSAGADVRYGTPGVLGGSGRGSRRTAVVGLVRACHPGPTVAVTALTTALAAASGRDAAGCGLVAGAILAGQLSVGWCNDAVDAERDTAAGRTDKPVATGAVSAGAVRAASVGALAACVPLSLASGPKAGAVHLVAVAGAWAYDLGLKSTVVSWLPYAVGFGALPAFVALGLPGHPWPTWSITLAAAALGCGAHLADVLPDIPSDLAIGVDGWPQRLGAARVRALVPVPLLAATALLASGPTGATRSTGPTRSTVPTRSAGRTGPTRPTRWTGPAGQSAPAGRTRSAVPAVPPGTIGRAALISAGVLTAAGWLLGGRSPRVPFATTVAVAAVDIALLLGRGTGITGPRIRRGAARTAVRRSPRYG